MKKTKILFAVLLLSFLFDSFCSAVHAASAVMEKEQNRAVPASETTDIIIEGEPENMKTIYYAGGCFWGTQKFFDQFDGVLETEVGYANGPTENPTYQEVCMKSGHAETVKVVYDSSRISLTELTEYYFMTIDPLAYHRQGADKGSQYRTGIYYTDDEDLPELEACYAKEQEKYSQRMEVELQPLENF